MNAPDATKGYVWSSAPVLASNTLPTPVGPPAAQMRSYWSYSRPTVTCPVPPGSMTVPWPVRRSPCQMAPLASDPTYTFEPRPTTRPSGRHPFGRNMTSGNDDESRAIAGAAVTSVATAPRTAMRRSARNGFTEFIWVSSPVRVGDQTYAWDGAADGAPTLTCSFGAGIACPVRLPPSMTNSLPVQ